MRIVFGAGPDGTRDIRREAPEYRDYRTPGIILVTVVNTGDVPLTSPTVVVAGQPLGQCPGEATVAPGGHLTCGDYLVPPEGTPGTTATFTAEASATAGGTRVTDRITGTWAFTDVVPIATLSLRAEPGRAPSGTLVRFHVDKGLVVPWRPMPDTTALTSAAHGGLLDPDNPEVTANTCPGTVAYQSCSFTAVVRGAPGATMSETVSIELTDGTGPTNTISARADVTIEPPPMRDAQAWAEASVTWPAVTLDHRQVRRRTFTTDVFDLPGRCERAVPARLQDLLATPAPQRGTCHRPWRLVRAATAALLNEAARGTGFAGRSVEGIRDDTVEVLQWGNGRAAARLAATYEGWNAGVASPAPTAVAR
ncbi:hypothetical protein [Agilicoccus flavus]|uniref:hypothetical protein n=1 Tax=Agilicoccus flavus TaxID=2775968 RepID=UPI001CF6458A|nr:hypothetical protein [Agilicoccus flavus]